MKQADLRTVADVVAPIIRDFALAAVASAVAPLLARIGELEARAAVPGPPGPAGERGQAGAGADPEIIARMVTDAVAAIPKPENGRDGRDGLDGAIGPAGKDADPELIMRMVADAVAAIPRPENGKDGRDGVDGKDGAPGIPGENGRDGEPGKDGAPGRDGQDGKDGVIDTDMAISAAADAVANVLPSMVADAVAAIPRPENGKDGAPGERGLDGAPGQKGDKGSPGADGAAGKDGTPGRDGLAGLPGRDGKDGLPGQDGADGLGFDDLAVTHDGARSVLLRFVRGEKVREFPIVLPVLIDRGVWREGEYQKADGVSFGGSFWIAQEPTTDKPGESKAWRLAVKRGRDGRDGIAKPPAEPKPVPLK